MISRSNLTEVAASGLRDKVQIEIDGSIFPEEAVLKAAYWMTDRCRVRLLTAPDGNLVAEISHKNESDHLDLSDVCADFENSLIDFTLRERLSLETRGIQEALLQRAFGEAISKHPNS